MPPSKTFRSNFNIGNVAAEHDPLLSEAYWDNGDYQTIASQEDPKCILIGRTGSGKSAALLHLEQLHAGQIIRIHPENLALRYITNLDIVHHLRDLGVRLDPFLKALWQHVIIVEVLKFRYKMDSPEEKLSVLQTIKGLVGKDQAKLKAIDYVDQFGDKFWVDTDERVKQIAESFEQKIKAGAGIGSTLPGLSANLSTDLEGTGRQEVKSELALRFQKIVDETQLARLQAMMRLMDERIMPQKYPYTYLVIDDLDNDWVESDIASLLIRSLIQTVIDFKVIRRLKILVALRNNIFEQLQWTEHGHGGQEEKVRGLAVWLRWTEGDLRALLHGRAEVACRFYGIDPPRSLSEMLPKPNKASGDPISSILSHTLMRPRDPIVFLNEAFREATGRSTISWVNLHAAERRYSHDRLSALRDEWAKPYADLNRVLQKFRARPYRMTRAELFGVLEEVAVLVGDEGFAGKGWLSELLGEFWKPGSGQEAWEEAYSRIVDVLYGISFLGIVRKPGNQPIYSYEMNAPASIRNDVTHTAEFCVHPAFRSALESREPGYLGRDRLASRQLPLMQTQQSPQVFRR